MSTKKETPKSNQGQRGKKYDLPFEDLTENELKVVQAFSQSSEPILTIKELVTSLGWDKLHASDANAEFKGYARGNSRVRNSLRRLTRGRWLQHASRYGDGRYKLTNRAVAELEKVKMPKRVLKKSAKARTANQESATA